VALSFGPALRPNSSRAALKALGQKSKVDFHGPYILSNKKNFRPRKFIDEIGRSYVLLISSGNHYSNTTYITTPTPIVIGDFASVLSDMCPTM